MTLTNGFAPTNGEIFNIIDYQSHTGTFSSVSLPTINGHFNLNYTSTGVTLAAVVVPEPASLILFAFAALSILALAPVAHRRHHERVRKTL